MGKRDLSMITICVQGTTDHEITYYLIDAPLLFRVTPPIGWMLVIFVVNDAWISSPLKVMVIGCVFSSKNYKLIFSLYFSGEFQMVQDIIRQYNLHSLWTSGRLCNFKGCDKPHLQPKNINGWFWSGSGKTTAISPTNVKPPGWPKKPWSSTGYFGQFLPENSQPQPDDAEFLLNGKLHEACLSVNNDWYGDGVSFHDSACFIPMAFICEDSDALLRKARSLSPSVPIN